MNATSAAAEESTDGAIRPRPATSTAPLSYPQELLWLLDRLSEGNAYNTPDSTRLEGPLDVDALRAALAGLLDRHEILRTTYAVGGTGTVQIVRADVPLALQEVDLSSVAVADRDTELHTLLRAEAERPFDLSVGPVFRATLVRLGPTEHVLQTVMHHIAVDGWSKALLWADLTELYEANVERRVPALPHPALQYADFAAWQRAYLTTDRLESGLRDWREYLRGAPAALELPTDRPRPMVQSYVGEHLQRVLPQPLLALLRETARREKTTLFMALLAAFGALLQRYSGQDDIVIGTPVAGRNLVELESLVGYCTNTLPLRLDLSGEPSFNELLRRARESCLFGFAHQEIPYQEIVRAVAPERDLSRAPLFQAMLVLQTQQRSLFAPAGLKVESVYHERGWSKFDLVVGMGERREGLNTSWEYPTELFDRLTVERMSGQFERLVRGACETPDRPAARIALLDETERSRLVVGFNQTERSWTGPGTLHGLVRAQVDATPAGVALVQGNRQFSYRELAERAHALAQRLVALGVTVGEPVAIHAERSWELAVALLGVLEAGAVCLPLDPTYPPARILQILDDSSTRVLVGRSSAVAGLSVEGRDFLAVDSSAPPEEIELPEVDGSAPAYLVYTSGSTGEPAGVLLSHRGLVNHARAAVELFCLTSSDRVAQLASPSFDISIEEIFPALACGAAVVWPEDGVPVVGHELTAWVAARSVSVLDLPTAVWHAWVDELRERRDNLPECLRLVVVGGEAASADTYGAWLDLSGARVRWINTYGPTETSVIVAAWEPRDDERPQTLPLGAPIANVRLYVLDERGELVPEGIPGELCVGGVGVALGYLGRPALTAARFHDDAFESGSRLFRTGDRVRLRNDGQLEFLGRGDAQVKVRGFRVEPGEIEAVLERGSDVARAAVVARTARHGVVLDAYVTATKRGSPPSAASVRNRLSERLPAFMVPASVTILDELPLTPNGKVDRSALPEPASVEMRGNDSSLSPLERELAELWADVLGSALPSRETRFFEAGGHSLLGTRLFARIFDRFGVQLPLRALFEAPTVAGLAAAVEQAQGSTDIPPRLAPLQRAERRG